MPQVLKQEVRERILGSALAVFAAHGVIGASMSMIAERAGLGAASLYRYYPSKDALFDAVITPDVARRFETLLDARVRALAGATLRGETTGAHEGEMLRFWLDHRLAVVVLLARAEGTRYGEYGRRFVEQLVSSTLESIAQARPRAKVSPPARFVLRRIFENTRTMLASVLAEHESERDVRAAIEAFWSYQIAGLRAFAEHVSAG